MFGMIHARHSGFASIGCIATWNHSRSWGYFPSGGLGLVLMVLVVLVLMGRI